MKYIMLLVMSLVFIGCLGGSAKPEAISYPSWYLNPPQNNASFLYGVGEGSNINIAKAAALTFVSESLSLTVSSELKKSQTSRRHNGNENTYTSVVSSLKAQAKEMEFSEYKIVKNEQVGSRMILLVEVSRVKLFNDQKSKLDLFSEELKAEHKSISQHPIFKQALLYKQRASKKDKLESLALLTKTINSGFDPKTYIKQARTIGNASQAALNKVRISISASSDAKIYVDAINEGLNNAGIKTGSSNTNTKLYIKNSFQSDEIYGFKIVKSTLSLTTKEKSKTIATNTVTLSGKSKYDLQKAKLNASHVLRKKIKEEGIFSVLGIK